MKPTMTKESSVGRKIAVRRRRRNAAWDGQHGGERDADRVLHGHVIRKKTKLFLSAFQKSAPSAVAEQNLELPRPTKVNWPSTVL